MSSYPGVGWARRGVGGFLFTTTISELSFTLLIARTSRNLQDELKYLCTHVSARKASRDLLKNVPSVAWISSLHAEARACNLRPTFLCNSVHKVFYLVANQFVCMSTSILGPHFLHSPFLRMHASQRIWPPYYESNDIIFYVLNKYLLKHTWVQDFMTPVSSSCESLQLTQAMISRIALFMTKTLSKKVLITPLTSDRKKEVW